jgi:transketolase
LAGQVLEVKEGNNIEAVINVITEAQRLSGNGKPICIIMHTEMGNGVDYMMGSHKWHGVAPNDEELEIALSQNTETLGDY